MYKMTSSKVFVLVFCIVLSLANFVQSDNQPELSKVLAELKTKSSELTNVVNYIERSINSYNKNDFTDLLKTVHTRLSTIPLKCLVSKKNQILNLSFDSITKIIACKNISEAANESGDLFKSGMNLITQILAEVVTAADVMYNCTQQNPFMSFSCIMGEMATIQKQYNSTMTNVNNFLVTADSTIKSIKSNVMYCLNSNNYAINNKLTSVVNVIQGCK